MASLERWLLPKEDIETQEGLQWETTNQNQIRKISFWKFSLGTQHNLSSENFGVWEDNFLLLKDTYEPVSYALKLMEASGPASCLCLSLYIVFSPLAISGAV